LLLGFQKNHPHFLAFQTTFIITFFSKKASSGKTFLNDRLNSGANSPSNIN
jgi:hypothetical protein